MLNPPMNIRLPVAPQLWLKLGSTPIWRMPTWTYIGMLVFCSTASFADPSARDLIVGSWDPGSAAFYDLPITVKPAVAILGTCGAVRYIIIRDRAGHGPGHNLHPESEWREIAIELRPKTPIQAKCLRWLVVDFSIPRDMSNHADIALSRSRLEFESKPGDVAWGVWGKSTP
jgi:hypothetical protein